MGMEGTGVRYVLVGLGFEAADDWLGGLRLGVVCEKLS